MGKLPRILEKIIGALSSKRNELKVRIMIFILLHKKMDQSSLMHSNFSHNLQALVANPCQKKIHDDNEFDEEEEDRLLMNYNKVGGGGMPHTEEVEEDKSCHEEELTRVLFEESEVAMEEEEEEGAMEHREGEDVIIVKEVVEVGEENVDQAAELFIKRFKREIHLQIN